MTKSEEQKIREEFRKEYKDSPNESIINNPKEIADYFISLINKRDTELRERIENMRMEWKGGEAMLSIQIADGYNQAITEIINLLKALIVNLLWTGGFIERKYERNRI